jgi:acetoin utilization protein AcuC
VEFARCPAIGESFLKIGRPGGRLNAVGGYRYLVEVVRVTWDETLTGYDFGPDHPMSPNRLDLTIRLARELGLLDLDGVSVVAAEPASESSLLSVHTPEYIGAVRAASESPALADTAFGLGTEDVPAFPAMHDVAARIVGATTDLARAVWAGQSRHGVNITGGMHHAMPSRASGFCIYNDLAVAIRSVLDAGAERVAYVDVDVHHGDGVERMFWDDPRVLTISLHETGQVLFPGTGFSRDIGGPGAEGTAVNVVLPPGTGDAGWLRAFEAVVQPLIRGFRPQMLFTQHGCDTHAEDPLAHLSLTVDAQRLSYEHLHDLASEVCQGRWLAVGGGGYEIIEVVPRAWCHLIGVAAHHPIDPETPVPQGWREYVRERFGQLAPARMTDGKHAWWPSWATGHDPADPVDRSVMATRRAVFPWHGLDPWFD